MDHFGALQKVPSIVEIISSLQTNEPPFQYVKILGSGANGAVVQVKVGGSDIAMKIIFNSDNTPSDDDEYEEAAEREIAVNRWMNVYRRNSSMVLRYIGMAFLPKERLRQYVDFVKSISKKVYRSAAPYSINDYLEPDEKMLMRVAFFQLVSGESIKNLQYSTIPVKIPEGATFQTVIQTRRPVNGIFLTYGNVNNAGSRWILMHNVVRSILKAYAYTESFGLVHMDVHPGNIMYDFNTKSSTIVDLGMSCLPSYLSVNRNVLPLSELMNRTIGDIDGSKIGTFARNIATNTDCVASYGSFAYKDPRSYLLAVKTFDKTAYGGSADYQESESQFVYHTGDLWAIFVIIYELLTGVDLLEIRIPIEQGKHPVTILDVTAGNVNTYSVYLRVFQELTLSLRNPKNSVWSTHDKSYIPELLIRELFSPWVGEVSWQQRSRDDEKEPVTFGRLLAQYDTICNYSVMGRTYFEVATNALEKLQFFGTQSKLNTRPDKIADSILENIPPNVGFSAATLDLFTLPKVSETMPQVFQVIRREAVKNPQSAGQMCSEISSYIGELMRSHKITFDEAKELNAEVEQFGGHCRILHDEIYR